MYIVASLLIHLLLVLGWAISEAVIRPDRREPVLAEVETEPEPEIAFELVEVPDNIPRQEPDAPSNLLSDRVARAADMNPEQLPEDSDPFYESDVDMHQYEQPDQQAADAREAQQDQQKLEEEGDLARRDLPEIEYDLTDDFTPEARKESRPAESSENVLSSVPSQGGISFNTYDWDFAPYMLAMKRAVERHLYPPYAFTHMGLISGDNIIRFVVSPDGTISDLRILESNAHYSLDRASVRAIEAAAPFMPLPSNFPEDRLEVTAHFSYSVRE